MKKLGTVGLGLLTLALAFPAASGISAAEPTSSSSTGDASVSTSSCGTVTGSDQLTSTITTFADEDVDALTAGTSYKMSISGALASGHCSGDTITVAIDHPLQANANASYPIYASDGTLAGQLVVNGDGTAATLTLNEWITIRHDVTLNAYLAVSVSSNAADTSSVTWTVNGTSYHKSVSPASGPCENCNQMPTWASKWGTYTQNPGVADDTIRVAVQLPMTTTAGTTTFTVTDEIGSEGQKFSCDPNGLNWRYYTSLKADGSPADGASTENGELSKSDSSHITVSQTSCSDTSFTATVKVTGASVASRIYIPVLVTDESRSDFPDLTTVTSDQGFNAETSATIHNDKGGGTLTGDEMSPAVEIVKKDADGNDADSAEEAVDLTGSNGSTKLVMTVRNTGTERLRNVTVSDEVTGGQGTVSGLSCDFSQASAGAPTSGTSWDGPFLMDTSFTCTADLTGVSDADHEDVASVEAAGWFTGSPVTSHNAYHARATAPAAPTTPATSAAPSSSSQEQTETTSSSPSSSQTNRNNRLGLPRTGAEGLGAGIAALAAAAVGAGIATRHRRK